MKTTSGLIWVLITSSEALRDSEDGLVGYCSLLFIPLIIFFSSLHLEPDQSEMVD